MRRSDLPLSERPPEALYVPVSSQTALRDDQKFWIGLCFCMTFFTLALGRWGAGGFFFTLAILVTPAVKDKLSLPQSRYRILLAGLFMLGCLSF